MTTKRTIRLLLVLACLSSVGCSTPRLLRVERPEDRSDVGKTDAEKRADLQKQLNLYSD